MWFKTIFLVGEFAFKTHLFLIAKKETKSMFGIFKSFSTEEYVSYICTSTLL